MTTYNLTSTPLICTPGILAWAINGYAFKADRKKIERVFVEGYSLPRPAVKALLSGAVPHTVTGETVTFTYPVPRLTQSKAKAELKERGITFRKTEFGEFRVNLAGAGEGPAYYTTDLQDALDTGLAMAETRDATPVPYKPFNPSAAWQAVAAADLAAYRGAN